jgi:hypothetical protein
VGTAIAEPHVIATTKPAAARILLSFIVPLLFTVDFELWLYESFVDLTMSRSVECSLCGQNQMQAFTSGIYLARNVPKLKSK